MEREPGGSNVIVLFLLALGLLASPALQLWAAPAHPWWLAYLIWALLILFIARVVRRGDDDGA